MVLDPPFFRSDGSAIAAASAENEQGAGEQVRR
jgi:hypothetical protein